MPHTPGPWTAHKSGSFTWTIRGNWHGEESHLAILDPMICQTGGPFHDEQAANARAMAAAPEALDALREMIAFLESNYDHNEVAMAACDRGLAILAKVEG
jgi:hypothetical protein